MGPVLEASNRGVKWCLPIANGGVLLNVNIALHHTTVFLFTYILKWPWLSCLCFVSGNILGNEIVNGKNHKNNYMEILEGIFKTWIPDLQPFTFSQEICFQELHLWPVLGVHTNTYTTSTVTCGPFFPASSSLWYIAWQHTGAYRDSELETVI